jgi:MinD superfamily P-loop ATPase
MIISIASGKGGTGKTTVATNLALSLNEVQLIDCDVEAPNANIFLNVPIDERQEILLDIPKIDKTLCDFCGKCSRFCMYNALAVVPSDILVFPELCHSCGGCKLVCPRDAIKWDKRVVGTIEHGVTDRLDFYHGLLKVGEIQAVPVIRSLKQKINRDKRVILDAPPGTSCPVIETVNSSDYCILVTEPTPFGLHDLKLAVEMIRYLKIPFGIIINRDGIGDAKVEEYCHKEKIPILMKIPHSKKIAHLYSKGIPFIHKLPGWKQRFCNFYSKIQAEVER